MRFVLHCARTAREAVFNRSLAHCWQSGKETSGYRWPAPPGLRALPGRPPCPRNLRRPFNSIPVIQLACFTPWPQTSTTQCGCTL